MSITEQNELQNMQELLQGLKDKRAEKIAELNTIINNIYDDFSPELVEAYNEVIAEFDKEINEYENKIQQKTLSCMWSTL